MNYSLADLHELRRSLKLRIAAEIATGDLELAREAMRELKEIDMRIETHRIKEQAGRA